MSHLDPSLMQFEKLFNNVWKIFWNKTQARRNNQLQINQRLITDRCRYEPISVINENVLMTDACGRISSSSTRVSDRQACVHASTRCHPVLFRV